MFIKRNRCCPKTKQYQSVLLVQGERVPVVGGRGRPRKDAAPKPATRVVHRTLANLSKLPAELVGLIEAWCKSGGQAAGPVSASSSPLVRLGPCYGVLAGLHALAGELDLVAALGPGRQAKLALFLIYARVAFHGSRLGAVRWAEDHAVAEVLGLESFDEDDLYAALDWLQAEQPRIEKALAAAIAPGAFFLYDVTSSYFEGQHNELAAHGYNRDGKRFKKQVVAGLLTDAQGEPLSIQLYPGNTSDPTTFLPAVDLLKQRFGAREVVLVGDRGMIKKAGMEKLAAEHLRYITALTDPQIRKLIEQKLIQPELFDQEAAELTQGNRRLILRLNPEMQARERQRRASQLAKLRARLEKESARLATQARAKVATVEKLAQHWQRSYKLTAWTRIVTEGRVVRLEEMADGRAEAELLDGCYVLVTDVTPQACSTKQVVERYLALQKVERDFRTMKTGELELRPIFLRKAERTEGHALVTMLALKLTRRLRERVAPLGLTSEDAVARLAGVRLVGLGPEAHNLWRLPDSLPFAQREILAVLPSLGSPVLSLKKPIKRRLKPRGKSTIPPL